MTEESGTRQFKAHEKVVAAVDLDDVPAGTRGKVMLRTGLTWIRYRVRFDNGVQLAWLDDRHLVGAKEYAQSGTEAGQSAS